MFQKLKDCILFELCLAKKKEEEDGRWTKLKISGLAFLTLLKVSGTFKVDLAL